MLSALNPDLILKHPLLPLPPQLTNSRFWHICTATIIRLQTVRQQRMAGDHQSSRTVSHPRVAYRQRRQHSADNEYPPILTEIASVQLPNLQSLSLISNFIASVEALVSLNAPLLENLHLSRNYINRVSPLRKAHLPRLRLLVLNDNPVLDCESLSEGYFPRLEFIVLENWADSNVICPQSNNLLKFQTQSLKFISIRSEQRITNNTKLSLLRIRFFGVQVDASSE